MKKVIFTLVFFALCAGFTSLVFADSLTFVKNPHGVTGPYQFQVDVNNKSYLAWLVCGSDDNHITPPNTWSIEERSIGKMDGVWGKSEAQWKEAAYYASLLLKDPGNAGLQGDVWASLGLGGSFDGTKYPSNWSAAGMDFYIPSPVSTTYSTSFPQPFIGTPEPASLVLLGSGLLGTLGIFRRRLTR